MQIPYDNAGVASVQTDSVTPNPELMAGDTPAVVTDIAVIPSAIATPGLPARTPVFVDPSTKVMQLAVQGTLAPNAITIVDIPAGAAANSNTPVYKAGCFNIRALNWPASYDTDAERYGAFAAAADCEIYIKKPYNVA